MLRIAPGISIDEVDLQYEFVHSSGPGGQNVNKVATACQLRFHAAVCETLPDAIKERLRSLAGRRMTVDGVLILDARRYRTQQRNREDATQRLVELLQRAATPPRPRHKTKPSLASRRRRLDAKRKTAQTKQLRRRPGLGDA